MLILIFKYLKTLGVDVVIYFRNHNNVASQYWNNSTSKSKGKKTIPTIAILSEFIIYYMTTTVVSILLHCWRDESTLWKDFS